MDPVWLKSGLGLTVGAQKCIPGAGKARIFLTHQRSPGLPDG
jgi:hypothetical protein